MDWQKFENSLREDSKRLQQELLKIPASQTASVAATGAAAMVLGLLANAVSSGASR
jgi:hypothetical protein